MSTALATMIDAQPGALEALADPAPTAAAAARIGDARRIWLVGTGTSQHAAELGASALVALGRDARWASASAFAQGHGLLRQGDAVVVLTHTAETRYALRSRQAVLDAGLPLVTVTGPASTWPEAIRTPVAETSETYTVSYTSALAVLAQLTHQLGAADSGPAAVRAVAAQVRQVLADPGIDDVPLPERAMAIIGPGDWSVAAREGALKIREGARVLCEGFDTERLLHGAAVPYGPSDTLLVLQPGDDPDGLTTVVAAAAGREGMRVATLTDGSGTGILGQIPLTVRLQRLALRFALDRGQDPDVVITGAWGGPSLWSV